MVFVVYVELKVFSRNHLESGFFHFYPKDLLHAVHQGIACVLVAALICGHLESKHPTMTLDQLDAMLSKEVYIHYKNWCKKMGRHATACSHRFSRLRFGKEKWSSAPELASVYKAAVVKTLMFWCTDYLKENCSVDGGNLRYRTMDAFTRFQYLLDIHGPFFSPEQTAEVVRIGRKGLLLYQKLAYIDKQRTDSRRCYKIIPKFHSFLELTFYIEKSNRNPRSLGILGIFFWFGVFLFHPINVVDRRVLGKFWGLHFINYIYV